MVNFFRKKAGFISKEWIPHFVNYRRDGYDFDALWDDEKATIRQKKIMDIFEGKEELYSFEVKAMAGFGNGGEKNFEGTMTDLQMNTYLCIKDFRFKKNKKGQEYGMAVAVITKPENIFGYEYVTSAYSEIASYSKEKIINHIKNIYPIATDKQIISIIK